MKMSSKGKGHALKGPTNLDKILKGRGGKPNIGRKSTRPKSTAKSGGRY